MTSFIAYTFSNTLGFALLTGSSVRYQLYSSLGLGTGEVARVILFCSITFFLGLLGWGGCALLLGQGAALLAHWPRWATGLLQLAGQRDKIERQMALRNLCGYLQRGNARRGVIQPVRHNDKTATRAKRCFVFEELDRL